MAITKTILKLTHQDAVVKVVNDTAGAASVTIALATDLKKTDETLSGTLDVRLSDVTFSVGASGGKIVRNAVDVLEMAANNHGVFPMEYGADPTQSASDVVVTIDKGTAIIRLLKSGGYVPTFQPEQKGGY